MTESGIPAPFAAIKHNEDAFQLATYSKMPFSVERGQGSWVWTR